MIWQLILVLIPVVAAIWAGRRGTKNDLAAIAVNVDGRLEAALEKIDGLAAHVAQLTGEPAPPLVAGQNRARETP